MIRKTEMSIPVSDVQEMYKLLIDQKRIVLNEPTGSFFYDPWTIKEEYKDTVFDKALSLLPKHGEARIIRLLPSESYYAHADIDDRYHMNIVGNYSYLIDLDNDVMHKVSVDGYWYDMDAGLMHVASNFGELYRFQIVVRHLLQHSESIDMVKISIEPNKSHDKLRYYFDSITSGWLNRVNKLKKMDNFTVTEQGCHFMLDKNLVDELKNFVHCDFDMVVN